VKAYYQYRADRIIGESNNGGDMVENTLRTVDPNIPVSLVWASRGKLIRAEPVAALYEQNRVHHVGVFTELENEMTQWLPGMSSPSRMDAMVWALTELALGVDNKMRIYDNHPWLDRV
jgi:phage terminase large subunit-like protein